MSDSNTPGSEKFGRYEIIEHLATGGMAKIYKASTSGNRIFTLKKILPEFSENSDFIRMFLEEAKISLNLKHQNVVRVLDFGQLEGSYYLAMEYVFGRDMGSILKRSLESRVHIPIEIASYLMLQCCRGLDYAHHQADNFGNPVGIVHRDISPPNILVSYNGEAKILDFGIAKAIRAVQPTNTRSGVLKGKFCYMSPEQARGEALNCQSDIFSLGIVLHELLTSRSLFYSQDEIETLEKVRKAKVDPPSKIRKGIPKALDRIVMKALDPKLRKRYATCGDFGDDLEAFIKEHYPRTDKRSVAKFLRQLFKKEFEQKIDRSLKEGWKDVFISGGADDEILLDRALRVPSTSPRMSTAGYRISWWSRIVYDPKISQKISKAFRLIVLLSLLGGLSFYAWKSSLALDLYQKVSRLIQGESPPTAAPPQADAPTAEPNSFQWWVQKAADFESQNKWDEALNAYDRALRINSFEAKILLRRNFILLRQGKTAEACPWFQLQKEIGPADRLFAEALCHTEPQKALVSFSDFLRRFPLDSRISEVQWRLDELKRKIP